MDTSFLFFLFSLLCVQAVQSKQMYFLSLVSVPLSAGTQHLVWNCCSGTPVEEKERKITIVNYNYIIAIYVARVLTMDSGIEGVVVITTLLMTLAFIYSTSHLSP